MKRVLITGGFGFIGGNLCNYWMQRYPMDEVVCFDSMTYASNPNYVMQMGKSLNRINSGFQHCYVDITKKDDLRRAMQLYRPDHVIHLAAESHVCRSIEGPEKFFETNLMGTLNMLETFKELWSDDLGNHRFHHVSTDEVYGVAWGKSRFHELLPYAPRSPYAASKAASDHLVMSYHHTYGVNALITNCSNNFGPSQHQEKLIPKTIECLFRGEPVRVYGSGKQVRDWIYVVDHCEAIDRAFHSGFSGQSYLVGGDAELTNLEVIDRVAKSLERIIEKPVDYKTIHTDDRPTDDQRYAIDATKISKLGWTPKPEQLDRNLDYTVAWYVKQKMSMK